MLVKEKSLTNVLGDHFSSTKLDKYGLLPKRRPVFVVIGKPIHVEKAEDGNPTLEQLQELQQKYIESVLAIWEKYKDKFSPNRTQELRIVA